MFKFSTNLSVVCTAVGVPWAGLVWLGGAMTSVPRFDAHDLSVCLPLPLLAVAFGLTSIAFSYREAKKPSRWALIAAGISLLTVAAVVSTYYDMRHQRYL